MIKNLKIIIDGKEKGKLEIEINKDEIRVIKLDQLPEEFKIGMITEGSICGVNYERYREMVQHKMTEQLNRNHLDKKVELIEYQTSSYSQKI